MQVERIHNRNAGLPFIDSYNKKHIDISNEILRRMGLKGPIVHNIIESKEDLVYQFQKYPGKTSGPALCLL